MFWHNVEIQYCKHMYDIIWLLYNYIYTYIIYIWTDTQLMCWLLCQDHQDRKFGVPCCTGSFAHESLLWLFVSRLFPQGVQVAIMFDHFGVQWSTGQVNQMPIEEFIEVSHSPTLSKECLDVNGTNTSCCTIRCTSCSTIYHACGGCGWVGCGTCRQFGSDWLACAMPSLALVLIASHKMVDKMCGLLWSKGSYRIPTIL